MDKCQRIRSKKRPASYVYAHAAQNPGVAARWKGLFPDSKPGSNFVRTTPGVGVTVKRLPNRSLRASREDYRLLQGIHHALIQPAKLPAASPKLTPLCTDNPNGTMPNGRLRLSAIVPAAVSRYNLNSWLAIEVPHTRSTHSRHRRPGECGLSPKLSDLRNCVPTVSANPKAF